MDDGFHILRVDDLPTSTAGAASPHRQDEDTSCSLVLTPPSSSQSKEMDGSGFDHEGGASVESPLDSPGGSGADDLCAVVRRLTLGGESEGDNPEQESDTTVSTPPVRRRTGRYVLMDSDSEDCECGVPSSPDGSPSPLPAVSRIRHRRVILESDSESEADGNIDSEEPVIRPANSTSARDGVDHHDFEEEEEDEEIIDNAKASPTGARVLDVSLSSGGDSFAVHDEGDRPS